MVRFFTNANYKFIERRKLSYTIAAFVLAACIGFGLFYQTTKGSWLNYGVDFAGGTLLQVRFQNATEVSDVRNVLTQFEGTEITRFGGQNEFLIRAPRFTQGGTTAAEAIVQTLRTRVGNTFTVVRTEAVGPKVGGELQRKAIIAIVLSFAATLIYLAVRFEWRFGAAAVIATIHDIVFAMALLIVFRMEVSLTTVAALLTIIGYSMNDKIIILDRVRENLKKAGRRRTDFRELLNRSINETLPRTTLTASTSLATLLSLAVLGGSILRGFAILLIFGIVIGTYSSMYIGAPVLYEIEKRWGGGMAGAKPTRERHVAL